MFLYQYDVLTYDKVLWEDNDNNLLCNTLAEDKHIFDNIIHKLEAKGSDVNSSIDDLSKVIFDISFKLHCKTFKIKLKIMSKRSLSGLILTVNMLTIIFIVTKELLKLSHLMEIELDFFKVENIILIL
jgi:hypothetical protein